MKSVKEKAKEYLESLPRDALSCYISMPKMVIAVSLAEQEAEERMRKKAAKAFCAANCPKGCSFGADGDIGCGAKARFIQKLNEYEND